MGLKDFVVLPKRWIVECTFAWLAGWAMAIPSLARYALERVVGLGPGRCGQPVLGTSFSTTLQQLDSRDGKIGVSVPGKSGKTADRRLDPAKRTVGETRQPPTEGCCKLTFAKVHLNNRVVTSLISNPSMRQR